MRATWLGMDLLTGEMVIAKGRRILSIIQHVLLSGIIRVRVAQSSDMEFGGGPASHRDVALSFQLETLSSGRPFPAFCHRGATWDALEPYWVGTSRIHFPTIGRSLHLVHTQMIGSKARDPHSIRTAQPGLLSYATRVTFHMTRL
jgi:hypothetical protein